MSKRGCLGEDNPNSLLNARTVREIRLLHLCDGVSASQIARDHGIHLSCISRIVNWRAWAHQDEDLKVIPKPAHRGGGGYHLHERKPQAAGPAKPTCRQCIHLTTTGRCDLEFPECIRSGFKEAARCSAFVPIPTTAEATSSASNGQQPTTATNPNRPGGGTGSGFRL